MVTSNAQQPATDAADSMTRDAPAAPSLAGEEAGALALLLAAERDHARHLAAADREALTILAEARASAERREDTFRRELDRELAGLRSVLEEKCARDIAAADAAALREAAGFDGMTVARIAVFADALLDHLFSADDGPVAGGAP